MSTRQINKIILHCSQSEWGSAAVLRAWHLARGWDDIGYHFIILNGEIGPDPDDYIMALNGSVEVGRSLNISGAHAKGHNSDSIGICLIGDRVFTPKQFEALIKLIEELLEKYHLTHNCVSGHNELPGVIKECPVFNTAGIRLWLTAKDILGV